MLRREDYLDWALDVGAGGSEGVIFLLSLFVEGVVSTVLCLNHPHCDLASFDRRGLPLGEVGARVVWLAVHV